MLHHYIWHVVVNAAHLHKILCFPDHAFAILARYNLFLDPPR